MIHSNHRACSLSVDALTQKAPVTAANLQRHVFVCTGSSCSTFDSQNTLEAFWDILHNRGLLYGKRGRLDGTVIVTTCGSLGLCAIGPAVLVYPDGVWYYGVTPEDVPEIVDAHLIGNHPVQRLIARYLPVLSGSGS